MTSGSPASVDRPTVAAQMAVALSRLLRDGETVFFLVRRDAATADGAMPLARGVWAIDAGGDNLRQVIGAEASSAGNGSPSVLVRKLTR